MNQRPTIAVIGQFPAGSSMAHAINVVKTAGGFARLGHRVVVCCQPPRDAESLEKLARDYAEPAIHWRFSPADLAPLSGDPSLAFATWAVRTSRDENASLVYARHFHAALLAAREGFTTALETHAHAHDPNRLLEECFLATRSTNPRQPGSHAPIAAIVTISHTLRNDYISRGADPDRVHIVPDGVDVELFSPRAHTPRPTDLPSDKPVALYAGHLYDYKGVPTILAAANHNPGVTFALLGGLPEDIQRAHAAAATMGLTNALLLGPRPHSAVPAYLWHADVLLLPPSARHPSACWTSPVKLGEYLAAGRPIVASDIPALRDWIDEPVVRWFTPDDGESLALAISTFLREPAADSLDRRSLAAALARRFSYTARARAILAHAHESPRHARALAHTA